MSEAYHAAGDVASREFVTLHLMDQVFGVEVAAVHDVFAPRGLTPVPMAPPEIAGVLNIRGRIVTALDARARLGLPPRDEARAQTAMAVGVERSGEVYGLIIDRVGEVIRFSDDRREPNPINLDPRWLDVADGVYRLERGLLIVLNLDRILGVKSPVSA